MRWDIITHCWETSETFQDLVTKSSVCLSDKQDPSLVTELCFAYLIFYELGYHGMALYMEMMYLLLTAFYDKSLNPFERVVNVSIVKTILTLWREELLKRKVLGKHFITKPTFDDVICSIDGLICYLLLATEFPDAEIVPWLLSSDACEQLFAFLRTGRFCGRRTNLTALTVVQGMAKRNRNLTLDEEGFHMMEDTIAHTRGRSLIPNPKKEFSIYKGKDITPKKIKDAIDEGARIGREKFLTHTNFTSGDNCANDSEDENEDDNDSDGEDDDCSDLEIDSFVNESSDEDEDDLMNFSGGRRYHPKTAAEKFLNDGRSRNPAQARFRRFRVVNPIRLSLKMRCNVNDGCKFLTIGQSSWFTHGGKRRTLVRGEAIFLLLPLSAGKSADRSSVSYDPVN